MFRTYVIGDTIRLTAMIVDYNNNPYDPHSVELSIRDPKGMYLLENQPADRTEKGMYQYDWTIDATCNTNLIAIWKWHSGSKTNIKRIKFKAVTETHF